MLNNLTTLTCFPTGPVNTITGQQKQLCYAQTSSATYISQESALVWILSFQDFHTDLLLIGRTSRKIRLTQGQASEKLLIDWPSRKVVVARSSAREGPVRNP